MNEQPTTPPTPPVEPEAAAPADTRTPEAPITPPTLPYAFAADLTEYKKRIGVGRIIFAGLLSLLIWLRFGMLAWIISVIVIVAVIIFTMQFLKRRSVEVTNESITMTSMLGKPFTIRFDEIENAKLFLNFLEASFGYAPRVSIAKRGEKRPMVFSSLYWNPSDLDKLVAVLNDKKLEVLAYEDAVQYAAIAKQFPEHATFIERHTIGLAVAIVLLIVVAVTVFVAVDQFATSISF